MTDPYASAIDNDREERRSTPDDGRWDDDYDRPTLAEVAGDSTWRGRRVSAEENEAILREVWGR